MKYTDGLRELAKIAKRQQKQYMVLFYFKRLKQHKKTTAETVAR